MRWTLFTRQRESIGSTLWSQALAGSAYAQALDLADGKRLRNLAGRFLATKSFDGVAGFETTPYVRALIALKACVPILNLGIDYYSGWTDIVVYPTDFRVEEEYTDPVGVVHRGTRDLCGQSLSRGPMVLSWDTIAGDRRAPDRDVVIHECAHKLDILNGAANGFPPLHRQMSASRWSQTFHEAYDRFVDALQAGAETVLDPYAATAPAEFFAVISETFFTRPATVYRDFRPAYGELVDFYRQDPIALLRTPA
jgi:Mlc titration factor MtfA (ptsG expression regulator)